MQEARYPRFAAVIAAIERTGKSRAEIGRMSGRDGSATTRWAKGTHMPAWSGAKALADAVRPGSPELADEVLAAWHYYSDPVEQGPGSTVPADVLAALRRAYRGEPGKLAEAVRAIEEVNAMATEAASERPAEGPSRPEQRAG